MTINNLKSDRFKRVASKRVEGIIKSIRSLSKCSNKNNYYYDEEDVNKMIKALKEEIRVMETLYRKNLNNKNTFNF